MSNNLESFLQHKPSQILDWVDSLQTQEAEFDRDVNWWLGLAEVASSRAFSPEYASINQPNLEWAHVAIAVYNYLAQTFVESTHSFMYKQMLLRVRLIDEVGVQENHPLLNIKRIVDWVFADLTMKTEEALIKGQYIASNLKQANPEEILAFQRLKGKLNLLDHLNKKGHLKLTEEIGRWLEVNRQLP